MKPQALSTGIRTLSLLAALTAGLSASAETIGFEEGYHPKTDSASGALLGQGGERVWKNWYHADKASPFVVVERDGNQYIEAARGAESDPKSAGLQLALPADLDLSKRIRIHFFFRTEGPHLPIGRFEAQTTRMILVDQSFFMLGFGANGVVHLYDGEPGKNTHWVKSPDGSAWTATPGTWHELEAVIDPVNPSYYLRIDEVVILNREGGRKMTLGPMPDAAKASPSLFLASINWPLGEEWKGVAFDQITIENMP